MPTESNTTNPSAERNTQCPQCDLYVGDKHIEDALAEVRHSMRLLTLGIVGLIESPHDLSGSGNSDVNANWAYELQGLAFDVSSDIDKILDAFDLPPKTTEHVEVQS